MSTHTKIPFAGKSTAIIIGALMLAVLGVAAAKELGGLDSNIAKRAVGVIFGSILIATGNILPKIVLPASVQQRNPAKARQAERFAGRTFVLAGILYIAVWMFAPQDDRMIISSIVGLSAFVLVALKWAFRVRSELANGQGFQKSDYRRLGIFGILHALLWVFAIFLADSIWGDSVAQWMAIVFVVVNGVLVSILYTKPSSNE